MRNIFDAGKILADLADKEGWTKEQLADILQIAPSNLYKKLKMNDLDTKFLRLAADAAGVEMSKLFSVNVTQKGKINSIGDSSINYKSANEANDLKLLTEQLKGMERENLALKDQIKLLNKLIAMYEKSK